MSVQVYDDTQCELGEGPLWHPTRRQLFWFDIWGNTMLSREKGETRRWTFDENVSAAGWVDRDTLLIASETRLFRFDLETGAQDTVAPLEADNRATRSNDGRADPWGGFWIGTMEKSEAHPSGAIYRYYKGELRRLYPGIQIPNAICFAPDRSAAYFSDTATRTVMRQRLDAGDGWPDGEPTVFLDTTLEQMNPDGAVTDMEGNVWCAFWGAGAIRTYTPTGRFVMETRVPGRHSSCPAFGGTNMETLFVTSARKGLSEDELQRNPKNGMTFAVPGLATGLAEPRVIL